MLLSESKIEGRFYQRPGGGPWYHRGSAPEPTSDVPRPMFFRRRAASLLVAGLLALRAVPGCAAAPLRVLPSGGLSVESAALLLSGQEGGTIPFAALAFPFPGDGDKARVPVVVEIDGTDLLAGQTDPRLRIEISLYALTGSGSVQGSRMDTVEIDLEQLGTGVGESGVRYVGEVSLLPDTYRLRILVRNRATGELGLRTLPVSVPPFRKSSGILLTPAFPDPGPDLWITARSGAASPLAALAPADLPSARPILAPGEETILVVAGWKLATDDLRIQMFRRIIEEHEEKQEKVADLPVRVTERRQGPGELEIFTVTFQPGKLDPGEYDLRATIPRSQADLRGDALSLTTRVVLFPGGSRGSVWAALNSSGRRSEAQVTRKVEPAPEQRRKPPVGSIRKSYREALARLAAGDPAEAAAAVSTLETSLLTGKARFASEDVAEIEVDLIRELARKKPEILEPVFMLHQRLYRRAAGGSNYLLMSHARDVALQIAAAYADLRTPEGRARSARLLLGLAADVLKTAPPAMRERMYLRILDLDEKNPDALVCRAVDQERQGKYPAAVDTLERLLRFHPGHGEGRLRLAVNRIRLGNAREGKRLLEELVSTPPDQIEPGIALLARQELARFLILQDDLDAAERLVRAGLERSPGDEKLTLQLALVRDLRQDARGAREALGPLEERSHPPHTASARHIYNALPIFRLETIRDELADNAAGHFADLAAALGRGEAP